MNLIKTKLPGVIIIEPDIFYDRRGLFLESFQAEKYEVFGIPRAFLQDNYTRSKKNVIRGLHGQIVNPQGKLIRAVRGEIFDVAVDMRRSSPTFGQWVGQILSEKNFRAMYIPPGFFHGFAVLSDEADVLYKCSAVYNPADEIGVRWDDPKLKIQWPVSEPILSDKDLVLPRFPDILARLPS